MRLRLKDDYNRLPSSFGAEADPLVFHPYKENVKIVFIVLNPTYYDCLGGAPLSGDTGEFVISEMEDIGVKQAECFFAYILPWKVKSDYEPSDFDLWLFLPYLRRLLCILQPKVVISLGNKAGPHLKTAFALPSDIVSDDKTGKYTVDSSVYSNHSLSKLTQTEEGIFYYNLEIANLKLFGLEAPHPFAIQGNERSLDRWDGVIHVLSKVCFPMRFGGVTYVDREDKFCTIRKDPTEEMTLSTITLFEVQEKKANEKKRKKVQEASKSENTRTSKSICQYYQGTTSKQLKVQKKMGDFFKT